MDFDEYQKQATEIRLLKDRDSLLLFLYLSLGLASEAGEYANKAKKIIRDDNNKISPERKKALLDELGDVLWYASQIAETLETPLSTVAQNNLDKLHSRKKRGVLGGSGDNR